VDSYVQSGFEGCNFLADFTFNTQLYLFITNAILDVINEKFYIFSFTTDIETD